MEDQTWLYSGTNFQSPHPPYLTPNPFLSNTNANLTSRFPSSNISSPNRYRSPVPMYYNSQQNDQYQCTKQNQPNYQRTWPKRIINEHLYPPAPQEQVSICAMNYQSLSIQQTYMSQQHNKNGPTRSNRSNSLVPNCQMNYSPMQRTSPLLPPNLNHYNSGNVNSNIPYTPADRFIEKVPSHTNNENIKESGLSSRPVFFDQDNVNEVSTTNNLSHQRNYNVPTYSNDLSSLVNAPNGQTNYPQRTSPLLPLEFRNLSSNIPYRPVDRRFKKDLSTTNNRSIIEPGFSSRAVFVKKNCANSSRLSTMNNLSQPNYNVPTYSNDWSSLVNAPGAQTNHLHAPRQYILPLDTNCYENVRPYSSFTPDHYSIKSAPKKYGSELSTENKTSIQHPMKPWNRADATKALEVEKDFFRSKGSHTVKLTFPDEDLSRAELQTVHPNIRRVKFDKCSMLNRRFCFIKLKPEADINKVIKNLNETPLKEFGGKCPLAKKVENISIANAKVELIDPYTIFIGNLPKTIKASFLNNVFPKATRKDIGYAYKLRNTRYALIRFDNVKHAIEGFKIAAGMKLEKDRDIILRFKRFKVVRDASNETESTLYEEPDDEDTTDQVYDDNAEADEYYDEEEDLDQDEINPQIKPSFPLIRFMHHNDNEEDEDMEEG